MNPKDHLILALDLPKTEALDLLDALGDKLAWVKIGMTLFYSEGPDFVSLLKERGLNIFLDLKLHDIPHQVHLAAASLGRLGVDMITVHASGGADMIAAAKEGLRLGAQNQNDTKLLAVSVLTSSDQIMLNSIGVYKQLGEQVKDLSKLAFEAGADGMVCSPQEASLINELALGEKLIVTPGIRPLGTELGDQKRVLGPKEALLAGSSHLVVGRPITQAEDPVLALETMYAQMQGA
ncbi:MAG: orotidine-5'-phosphate decarboxylase [Coriobacteriia bacterium]|nr:orotidine-5'-phosphate decarboxylase [Coriobacteriia bacterium]